MMTDAQETFIRSLAEERELDAELKARLLERLDDAESPVEMKQASLMIKWLIELPVTA